MRSEVPQSSHDTVMRFVRAILTGALCGAVMCALLLVLCAFFFVKAGNIPETATVPCVIALSCVSSLFAGFVASRITKSKGLVMGLAAAGILFLLVLLSGLISVSDAPSVVSCLLRCGLMLLSGSVGGIFGVNRRRRRK